MSQTYLTKKGLEKLREEYQYLIESGRRDAAEKIKTAIEAGGYDDNLLYDMELEKQLLLEKRISELEDLLRDSEVIDGTKIPKSNFITVGCSVVVECDGEKDKFVIVGSFEADPVKNLISNESPVGQALIGAKVGDVVEVTTPVVKLKYKVLEILAE